MTDGLKTIRVLNRPETIRAVGVSERTWERLEATGDVPPKTRFSEGRVGYRIIDIERWLDARREDGAWKKLGDIAERLAESCSADIRDAQIRLQRELNQQKGEKSP